MCVLVLEPRSNKILLGFKEGFKKKLLGKYVKRGRGIKKKCLPSSLSSFSFRVGVGEIKGTS